MSEILDMYNKGLTAGQILRVRSLADDLNVDPAGVVLIPNAHSDAALYKTAWDIAQPLSISMFMVANHIVFLLEDICLHTTLTDALQTQNIEWCVLSS